MNYQNRQLLLEASDAMEDVLLKLSDAMYQENEAYEAIPMPLRSGPSAKSVKNSIDAMAYAMNEAERVQDLIITIAKKKWTDGLGIAHT